MQLAAVVSDCHEKIVGQPFRDDCDAGRALNDQ